MPHTQPTSLRCSFQIPIFITPFTIKIILSVWIRSNFIESIDLAEHFLQEKHFLHHALKNCTSKNKESKFQDKLHVIQMGNNHSFQWHSSFDLNATMNNAVYLAVSKVCSWSLTSGFISSTVEELLSTAPLLMSGFVRCSQKVKYFNTKWHPERY